MVAAAYEPLRFVTVQTERIQAPRSIIDLSIDGPYCRRLWDQRAWSEFTTGLVQAGSGLDTASTG